MTEKLLIIGRGFLGNAIFSVALDSGINPIGTHYSKKESFADVSNIDSIEKIVSEHNPDFIINSAALTAVDQIESFPYKAYEVNANGAKNVALIADKKKIRLVHISTDGVFDGTRGMYSEEDLPNPINEYAKSKKLGEDFVKEVSDKFVIVRTNFYGYNKDEKFLFNWILQNLVQQKPITAFDDVIFNPLEIKNLSKMLIELLHTDFAGMIHLSSDEVMSKYQFAVIVANTLGFDINLIRKGSLKDSNLLAKRPANTSLSNLKAKKLLKTEHLTLEEWLKTLIR